MLLQHFGDILSKTNGFDQTKIGWLSHHSVGKQKFLTEKLFDKQPAVPLINSTFLVFILYGCLFVAKIYFLYSMKIYSCSMKMFDI